MSDLLCYTLSVDKNSNLKFFACHEDWLIVLVIFVKKKSSWVPFNQISSSKFISTLMKEKN